MTYYLGIDGGGTKTKAVLVDEKLTTIAEFVGGPSNFLVFGLEKVSKSLLQTVSEISRIAKIEPAKISTILLGTAGAGRRNDAERLEKSFIEECANLNLSINGFRVESDARIALEGAFSGNSGSILIAGTGSIMFGKDSQGKIHRVGGFGRILGDEGSGFHIGRAGLTAVAKHFDSRGRQTNLSELLKDQFDISSSSELITAVYKNNFDIAAVAPLVIQAAEQGDEICENILMNEVDELISHFHSMKKLINEIELKVSLIGGTITTDNYYARLFAEKAVSIEGVKITEPELKPEYGAAIMAKNLQTKSI